METRPNLYQAAHPPTGRVALIERPDTKLVRLAELVMHLTDCTAERAWDAMVDAVRSRGYPEDYQQCLARVARAIGTIRAGIHLDDL